MFHVVVVVVNLVVGIIVVVVVHACCSLRRKNQDLERNKQVTILCNSLILNLCFT